MGRFDETGTSPGSRRDRGGKTWWLLGLIALGGASAAYGIWLYHIELGVGWYHDDGIYTITANAIADGRGPRLDFLPGAPYAAKYPLLWPALLAGVIALSGAKFGDLTGPLVVAPNAIFISLALVAYAVVLRRSWRFSLFTTVLLVLALALNHGILEFVRFPMSEILYVALSLGAVALCDASGYPASRKSELGAAILAVAAMHTRLIGVTLVAALLLAFAVRRRWFAFFLTGILAATTLGGWFYFLHYAASVDAPQHASALMAYNLDYRSYTSGRLGHFLPTAVAVPRTAFSASDLVMGASLPRQLLTHARTGGSPLWLFALVIGFVGVSLMGIRARSRCNAPCPPLARVESFYVPLYLGVLLLWPSVAWRLLIPLAPWLLALPVKGIAAIPFGRSHSLPAVAASVVILGLTFTGLGENRAPKGRYFMAGSRAVDAVELEQALAAVRGLPADARIGSPLEPLVFLRTGRLGLPRWIVGYVVEPGVRLEDYKTLFVLGAPMDKGQIARAIQGALDEYTHLGVNYIFACRMFPPDSLLRDGPGIAGARSLYRSTTYGLYRLPGIAKEPKDLPHRE